MAKLSSIAKHEATLREKALSFPESREDMPWGHSAFKVKAKSFCFMSNENDSFGASFKLPETGGKALLLPFAEPTGYGLGKAGWVSVHFKAKDKVPMDLLFAWLAESYRAVAPKKLVQAMAGESKPNLAKRAVRQPKRKNEKKAASRTSRKA